jgi:hypothetical protein
MEAALLGGRGAAGSDCLVVGHTLLKPATEPGPLLMPAPVAGSGGARDRGSCHSIRRRAIARITGAGGGGRCRCFRRLRRRRRYPERAETKDQCRAPRHWNFPAGARDSPRPLTLRYTTPEHGKAHPSTRLLRNPSPRPEFDPRS